MVIIIEGVMLSYSVFIMIDYFERISNKIPFIDSFPLFTPYLSFDF